MLKYYISLISLLLAIIVQAQTATIKNVWSEHNVSWNGKNGMRIHTHFSVSGMKGNKVRVVAFFYDANKRSLMTSYSNYQATDGSVCVGETSGNIFYENAVWKDFTLFIPYEAMNFAAGKHTYYFRVYIRPNNSSSTMTSSQYYTFSATGSNTKTIRSADGTIMEQTTDEDEGTITTITTKRCMFCFNGTCSYCNGRGGIVLMTGFNRCTLCFGTGKCKYCQGTGMYKTKFIYHTTTGTGMLIDLQTGNVTYSGPGMDTGNSNQGYENHNHSPRRTIDNSCPNCHGTGRCTMCAGRGEWKGSDGRYYDCDVCHGGGQCPSCYGSGKLR